MTDHTECFEVASSSIGRPIRVDFVKGSRKPCVTGNLFTKDPESGTIVLVQQQQHIVPSDQGKCTRKFVLIPGNSIRGVQSLDESALGVENKKSQFEEESKNNTELLEEVDGMFRLDEEAMAKSHGKRTLSETVRIFDHFTLSRRHRLIDALNKYGIKFSEKPHVLVGQEEALTGDATSTIIALQVGGIKIYPPYGKGDIIGGGSIAVKELLHKLTAENIFMDEATNQQSAGDAAS